MIFLVTVILYLLAILTVAIVKSRQARTQEEFMVAGRRVSAIFLAGTLVCTWIGSGSLFGGAGLAFREGFADLWLSAGAWVGIIIIYFLAHRVRRISQYTVADILEKRYHPAARVLGTIVVIVAYMAIAGYQFRGGGRLLNIVTTGIGGGVPEISVETGRIITCVAIIGFTMLAGLVSIVAVDIFNGILMVLGVVIAIPLTLAAVGGWDVVTQTLPPDHFTAFGAHGAWWAFGVFFPTLFLLLGESSMYQKFFSARDARTAQRAVVGMIIGVVIIETALVILAVIGAGKYWNAAPFRSADGSLERAVTETIILYLARHDLPVLAGSLLLGAGMAIIFSTGNTFLMIPATNVTRDIYQRFINPNASDKSIVLVQRIAIAILGVAAFLLATQFTSILAMALTAYTMVGAGLTPALLAAFLWKRVTPAGGVASIATGMFVTLVLTIFDTQAGALLSGWLGQPVEMSEYIIYPAVFSSIAALVIVSVSTAPSPEEKWKPFMESSQ
jgi:SSS family solute:Na+ symporter